MVLIGDGVSFVFVVPPIVLRWFYVRNAQLRIFHSSEYSDDSESDAVSS